MPRVFLLSLVVLAILPFALGVPTSAEAEEDEASHREKLAEKRGVSRAAVSAAIDRGAQHLLDKYARGFDPTAWNSTLELVMLTLAHAGVDEQDEVFCRGLKALEECKLQYTYRVAALAMALARIDHWKYRARLAHCAQWLVNTQLAEGEWGYPRSLAGPNEVPKPVEVEAPEVTEASERSRASAYGAPAVKIRRRRAKNLDINGVGDISNTQFAILGLKACLDAKIQIPATTWKKALSYIRKYQRKDGGWGYVYAGRQDHASYSSMTCAGICSIAICRHGLRKSEPAKHAAITRALAFLGKHFSTKENYGITESYVADPTRWFYYYLYSVERVGQLVGIDEIGDKEWYPVGAEYLLANQKADGSWWTGVPGTQWKQAGDIETADTCFAILFLTRSTPRFGVPVVTGADDEEK